MNIQYRKPEPWERQPGETNENFARFRTYRDMGPTRSVNKAYRAYYNKPDVPADRIPSTFSTIASKWEWNERARAWDMENDRLHLLENQMAARKMAKRHAKVANLFIDRLTERLLQIDADKLSPSDLARWFEVASKIERLSLGEASEVSKVHQHTTGQSDSQATIDIRSLSNEQLKNLKEIRDILKAQDGVATDLSTGKVVPMRRKAG